jgi:hypothetical protein
MKHYTVKTYGRLDLLILIFLTWALVEGELSASRPDHFTHPVPSGQEASSAPEPVWLAWKGENSCPYRDSNSNPSAIQPVASRYTDYAPPRT